MQQQGEEHSTTFESDIINDALEEDDVASRRASSIEVSNYLTHSRLIIANKIAV